MNAFKFLITVLAAWRITHLIQAEDGPWDIIFKIRKSLGNGFWGNLMDCFYCTSIWISLPFAIFYGKTLFDFFSYWMAISGGAILLQKISSNKDQAK
jgi:hypothetical protein